MKCVCWKGKASYLGLCKGLMFKDGISREQKLVKQWLRSHVLLTMGGSQAGTVTCQEQSNPASNPVPDALEEVWSVMSFPLFLCLSLWRSSVTANTQKPESYWTACEFPGEMWTYHVTALSQILISLQSKCVLKIIKDSIKLIVQGVSQMVVHPVECTHQHVQGSRFESPLPTCSWEASWVG